MENRDFIITSSQSWDIEIGSTIKSTAIELSKQNRVLFINPPMDFNTRLHAMLDSNNKKEPSFKRRMQVIRGKADPIRIINPNFWVIDCPFTILSISKLPSPLFRFFNWKNNCKFGNFILREASALGFKNFIHLIDTDLFRSHRLKEIIHPAISIYYRRDYVIGFPYWRRNGPRCEKELTQHADIVLANSSFFAEELRRWNSNTYVVNTGVNLELYNAALHQQQPHDMDDIPHPIVGYTGAIIQERIDCELLNEVIRQLPQYSFVFVGPEDDYFAQSQLHSYKNVFFLGRRQVDELPDYINSFDVCINPQLINPITNGNYPLKVDEYLAMGKPIVAANTHTMRDVFGSYTYLPNNVGEWIDQLQAAVREATNETLRQERIAFAHTHSWGHSVATIYHAIEEYDQQRCGKNYLNLLQ
jgi:glycosyltransferase involved in cell wall biosynthesis